LENTNTKSKAISYILKTFKLNDSLIVSDVPAVTTQKILNPAVKTTPVKKTSSSD